MNKRIWAIIHMHLYTLLEIRGPGPLFSSDLNSGGDFRNEIMFQEKIELGLNIIASYRDVALDQGNN